MRAAFDGFSRQSFEETVSPPQLAAKRAALIGAALFPWNLRGMRSNGKNQVKSAR
jgi:hypothetical protein